MLNLSDNELDKLSREAAEKFEPAENAQSWNKLQQLLDKNLGKPTHIPKTIRPGTILLYSGAMLIAVTVTYFLTKSKKNNKISTPQISTIINQKLSKKDDSAKNSGDLLSNNLQQSSEAADINDKTSNPRVSADNHSEATSLDKKRSQKSDGSDKKIKQGAFAKHIPPNASEIAKINNLLSEKTLRTRTGSKELQKTNGLEKKITEKSGNNNNNIDLDRASETQPEKNLKIALEKEKNNTTRNGGKETSTGVFSARRILSKDNTGHQYKESASDLNHPNSITNDEKNRNNQSKLSSENTYESSSLVTGQLNDELKYARFPGILPAANASFFSISDTGLRAFNASNKLAALINPERHTTRRAFIDHSLQIGILFAPEFSEVKHIYQNNKLGNNFGISISYQLFSKVSINSGIIFSKKYYQANQQGFHAPPGTVGNDVAIKFVDASAKVIDIPLNVRYNYFSDENSTFFVNAGFSSYLVSKQSLNLYCQPNTNNNSYALRYSGTWVQPNIPPANKNYPFSILNLSTGFETSMGNNFSFQFEPYLKLPVKGIGVGKVDLSSYGINFSLKYAPVLKRSRR